METNTRFKDAPWIPEEDISIILGGVGGIGTWFALFISRALGDKLKLIMYDPDTIEAHNLGGQFFKHTQKGMTKTRATEKNLEDFCGTKTVIPFSTKYDLSSYSHIFMVSAFDNMKARKDMFEKWKTIDNLNAIFIDGRLLAEQLQIFCVTPSNISEYEKYLFDDKDVPDAMCTFKQTTHIAAMIGTYMTTFLLNHLVNIKDPSLNRTVPFYFEYLAPLHYFNNL